ncbi:trypsin-like serine protease, partial [bacterium]|nr:trypsin-like serine protease [bacterium]
MKRSFMLFAVFMACFSLFAENHEAHSCLEYAKVMFPNYDENPDDDILEIVWDDPVLSEVTQFDDDFIPDWFEHFEFADGNYGYDEEFLQEHGGRVGKIISMNPDSTYGLGCSGTLIGENYFLTAGHCANIANVGVLFGYQIADLYEDNDGTNHPTYPRVSLTGYLNDNGNYILYEDPGSEYSDVTEHPAYFPIDKNFQYRYNDDYSVENGLAKVGWISEEDNIAQYAETILWPNDDPDGEEIGKIDYAIYKLESKIDFSQSNEPIPPSKWLDPWSWVSENNQDDEIPDKPWRLLDNTNGKRGWARVNTGVLQENSTLSIIGFPGVASESVGNINYSGLKVVNNGSVDNDQYRGYAFSGDYEEDLLIFKDADIQTWHSGSSVIDYSGKLAGLVAWFGCAPGGWDEWSRIMQNIKNEYITLQRPATNYATPMWKICRASQIIKNAAKDTDCNGRIDWQDFIFATRLGLSQYINIGIDFNLIKNFEIPTTVEEIHIHRFDMDQKKVVTETKEIP